MRASADGWTQLALPRVCRRKDHRLGRYALRPTAVCTGVGSHLPCAPEVHVAVVGGDWLPVTRFGHQRVQNLVPDNDIGG
jgi:hypothetical protein